MSRKEMKGLNCLPSPSMYIFLFCASFRTKILITKSSLSE